jgi:hypothetical protein
MVTPKRQIRDSFRVRGHSWKACGKGAKMQLPAKSRVVAIETV